MTSVALTPHMNAIGEDGPMTPEQCAAWLDAKYARHGELEDQACAKVIRNLCQDLESALDERDRWQHIYLNDK